ncbi:hypothetical protein [Runella limosa]|uniref:hypothetical protein n=1 Tax=Runella limosa TaxID=370978 RepID=UPI00040F5D1F|nr:hypothetical protein [Runella limosa]
MSEEKATALKNHLKDVASLYDIQDFCFVSVVDMEKDVQQAQIISSGENEIIDFIATGIFKFISSVS